MRIPEWWRAAPDAEGASLPTSPTHLPSFHQEDKLRRTSATPGNNPTRTEVSSPRLVLTLVLAQIVHHALEWPIIGMFDQPMADGVFLSVQPFHFAGLIAPHLPVPKAPLPSRNSARRCICQNLSPTFCANGH
jgi:hypothetical protein